eukprot:scaffold27007_cov76-Amphora_coffeaeformis.AAC.1
MHWSLARHRNYVVDGLGFVVVLEPKFPFAIASSGSGVDLKNDLDSKNVLLQYYYSMVFFPWEYSLTAYSWIVACSRTGVRFYLP